MPKQKAIEACDQYINCLFDFLRTANETYYGMHLRDLQVLYYILSEHDDRQVTVSELAYHLNITPAAASQVVSGYEKKGWIKRVRSLEDRRTVYLQVNDDILKKIRKDWELFDQNLSKELSDVPQKELEGFVHVMDTIIEYFDRTHMFLG